MYLSEESDDGRDGMQEPAAEEGWREVGELLFEDAEAFDARFNTTAARLVNGATILVILASQIILCLETLPQYYQASLDKEQPWFSLEVAVVSFFTVELAARFAVVTHHERYLRVFFFNLLNVIDILAVLPFYVELVATSRINVNISVLRILRVIRVIKMSRRVRGLVILAKVLYETMGQLYMGFLLILVSLYFWGSLLFFLERSAASFDEEHGRWVVLDEGVPKELLFQSIPHSFWWGIATLTTVGYGDVVPRTWAGKLCASASMISAVFVLALPTSIIGAKFLELYKRGQSEDKIKSKRLKKARETRHLEEMSESEEDDLTEEGDASVVGGREDEIVELLMFVDDLAETGRLTPSSVLQDAASGEVVVRPGDGEAIRSLILDPLKYPAVRAVYMAARQAPTPSLAISRFLQHATELALQSTYSHGTAQYDLERWQPNPEFVKRIHGMN